MSGSNPHHRSTDGYPTRPLSVVPFGMGRCALVIDLVAQLRESSSCKWEDAGSIPVQKHRSRLLSILYRFSTGRRIGLSLITTWSPVRVRPPEPNAGVAQLVEHVIPSSFLIRRFFERAVDCGLSELLVGGSNPPFRFGGSSSIG